METRAGTSQEPPQMLKKPFLQDGRDGWRHHWRHGLVGAINYWAGGSRENVVKMLVTLARDQFGVGEEMADALHLERDTVTTMRAIADNVRKAVGVLKTDGGSTEEQRKEYSILLAAAFGAPSMEGERHGTAKRIGEYLH
ncbi:hypothetical protein AB1Y20_021546 [Prymnesium parvum]|uniref:Uncharacterized protein n=1 Tax=Prymnesium parvum TaxID=97485 RepID=A0AB34JIJ9_PRYPA